MTRKETLAQPLKGKWIVITRPKKQSGRLKKRLESAGASVIDYPLIQIAGPSDPDTARQKLAAINLYDLVIFVSANAVESALKWSCAADYSNPVIAAIGKKTAGVLEQGAIAVDIVPQAVFNSEALLALPQMAQFLTDEPSGAAKADHCAQRRIAIIRGEGGRELLADTLRERGAIVDYINVYRRLCPQNNCQLLNRQISRGELDTILLTSSESVASLFRLCGDDSDHWQGITLLLGSERMREQVPARFAGKICVASDPGDDTLYSMLTAC